MNLLQKQFIFNEDVIKLLIFIKSQKFNFVIKEALRPQELSELYKQQGKSWIINSKNDKHGQSLAIDICIFSGITWLTDYYAIKPIGDYWTTLRVGNVWGGNWTTRDLLHFEYAL